MPLLSLPNNTLLVITPLSGISSLTLTPFAVRGLTQTLEPIMGSALLVRRDVSGTLHNLTYPFFYKYQSTISCTDQSTPCLDDAWIGQQCTVDCAAELNYPLGGMPFRPVVPGSIRGEGHFEYYRPILTMMVKAIKNTFREWRAEYAWSIELEEV